MENMNSEKANASPEQPVSQIDTTLTDVSSCSTHTAYELQDSVPTFNGDLIDISILEGNLLFNCTVCYL